MIDKAFYNDFAKFGERKFAIDEVGKYITYEDLNLFCKKLGEFLTERKLVFVLCENSIECLSGYVAFLYNCVVPLMIDKNSDSTLIDNLIGLYYPDYLYAPKATSFSGYCIVFENEQYCLHERLQKQSINLYDELALLLTTSGSTGSSKLVRQSYTNIQVNAMAIAEYLKLDSNERPITTLPLNYTYGLSVVHSHMTVGATILITSRNVTDKLFWDFFKRENATSIAGVPFTYEMLKRIKFMKMELPSLRTMTQAGGKLSLPLHEEYAKYSAEHGINFVVMYGQTEATARMAYLPSDKALEKIGSTGVAIPGGRFELIDANSNVINEPETVGELIYYGDNVTLGYAECPEDLSLGDLNGKKLVTGDMAKFDPDGYIYIVGRKKRFLKIFGSRVNLDELERLVKNNYADVECVCGGRDDLIIIYIVKEYEVLADEIKGYLINLTDLNHKAFDVCIVDEIPKNSSGKIEYAKLAAMKG